MGVHTGPLPAASIDRMAPRYGDEAEVFRSYIRAMDAAYLREVRKPPGERRRVDRSQTFGPAMMRGVGR